MNTQTMSKYDPISFEAKWQQFWQDQGLFQSSQDQTDVTLENKQYILFAFAYPSGEGLHVGHVESKTALDIVARFNRMNGKKVFFPVGWDAFGLPAENYAIKTGVHPAETTRSAIENFRRQIKRVGISYDWANEIATSHPEYYRWTQWIFLKLFEKGLAYQNTGLVNWCPSCQTVLANEQVVEGACERCGTQVVQKELKQWYFKITDYQDELICGLEKVDWPKATKQQQLNWIGKSKGITITFQVVDSDQTIDCFTTWSTNWGASFLVLAPEHPIIDQITTPDQKSAVEAYVEQTKQLSESERTRLNEKTGVFTGAFALNHVTNEKIPIWISNFVIMHVGTGAVQGCPGHDMRDFEFAKKFGLPIPRVVVGPDGDDSPIERPEQVIEKGSPGKMINSDFINGMDYKEGIYKTMDHFVQQGWGKLVTNYKLRDWLISRQRYWGTPIPIVYDPEGNPHPVKEEHLPWLLPTDVEFKPTGESPLKHSKEFIERTERLYGQGWRPEFDTMDTFVDSSWYFLRYVSARNQDAFSDPEKLQKWLPVDLYMIGPEHIVLHLLYSRFFTKFLRDEGYVSFDEPFIKMRHQGMILGPDNKKMSKSKGNVINPDEIIDKFGADSLRVYEMFMGPLDADKAWDTRALIGVQKFLGKMYRLVVEEMGEVSRGGVSLAVGQDGPTASPTASPVVRKLHQTIIKVTQDIPLLKFNTAIACLMELSNTWSGEAGSKPGQLNEQEIKSVVKVLAPFAPFLAEELYQQFWSGQSVHPQSVHLESWPEGDEKLAAEDEVVIAIQINGKLRDELTIPTSQVDDQESILTKVMELPKILTWTEGKSVEKKIYVPGKVVNLVVR